MAFRGQYDYSLDAKNRVNLPPKFRAQLADGLVVSRGVDRCITIFPPDAFDEIQERVLDGVRPFSAEHRDIRRQFNSHAFELDLDASGRVRIESVLLDYASIEKKVLIVGCKDYIEIWNPESWEAAQDSTDIEQIVGGLGHTA